MDLIKLPNFQYGIRSGYYSPSLVAACKSTPGMRFDRGAGNAWVGYRDAVAVVLAKLRENTKIASRVPALPALNARERETDYDPRLHNYQRQGVEFIVNHAHEGVLLADAMGLGKTATTLFAVRELKASRTLIVCPDFVKHVWEGETAKWIGWPSGILEGTKPELLPTEPILICNYHIANHWLPFVAGHIDAVVFDEIHYLQSPPLTVDPKTGKKLWGSARSAACAQIAAGCTYRIGLTGTPIPSRPRDFWNPVNTLSPGRFGEWWDYQRRYCDLRREEIDVFNKKKGKEEKRIVLKNDGGTNLDELNVRTRHFMLRRTKTDVALELPPLTRQILDIDVPGMRALLLDGTNATSLRDLLGLSAKAKVPTATEIALNHVSSGSKVVVFTHRKDVARGIALGCREQVPEAIAITGDESREKRIQVASSEPRVLVCTMDSFGVGVSLTWADVVIFAELDWVPGKILQCEKRLDRQGQTKPVLALYLIARGTADEYIKQTVITKLEWHEQAIGRGDDRLLRDLSHKKSDAEILREFRESLAR